MGMPAAPAQIISKINPALSEVIMKALAKLPEQRYQSGQDLVNDLEQCKEGAAKASPSKPAAPAPSRPAAGPSAAEEAPAVFGKKVAAAAAGWSGSSSRLPEAAASDSPDGGTQLSANMSAAWPTESETEVSPPPSNGDGNPAGARRTRSFSDVDELPPLKTTYVSPPAPPEAIPDPPEAPHQPQATVFHKAEQAEKSRTPPKEMARNAIKAIAKTPPKLFLYSVGAAVVIILLVGGSIFYRNQSEKSQEMAAPAQVATPAAVSSQPAPAAPESAPGEPPPNVQMATPVEAEPPSSSNRRSVISVAPASRAPRKMPGKHRTLLIWLG